MELKAKKTKYCSTVCKAWCCRFIICDFVSFTGNNQEDDLFFSLRGVKRDKATNKLHIPLRCHWLTNHNTCRCYTWRPQGCKEYECEDLKKMTTNT